VGCSYLSPEGQTSRDQGISGTRRKGSVMKRRKFLAALGIGALIPALGKEDELQGIRVDDPPMWANVKGPPMMSEKFLEGSYQIHMIDARRQYFGAWSELS